MSESTCLARGLSYFVVCMVKLRAHCFMENDKFTTPPQQLHNIPSHGGGAQCVGPTPCEEMLYNCCGGVV
jgi:hypothetical protein